MPFWKKIRDSLLHKILFSAILILATLALYFGIEDYRGARGEIYSDLFPNTVDLAKEQAVQEGTEKIKPGSIHVPILIYHSVRPHLLLESPMLKRYTVSPEAFSKQLSYLKENGYSVIGLGYLSRILDEEIPMAKKSVVLTFDDGWQNQYQYAFPLLQKYGYTATFFVFTNAIDKPHFLSLDEIQEMDVSGMTIGSHTVSHPYLPDLKNKTALKKEITDSKKILEDDLGHSVDLFAYPFGHYSDDIISAVKEAGYSAARSTYVGTHHTRDDLYTLKGIEVTDDLDKFISSLGENSK